MCSKVTEFWQCHVDFCLLEKHCPDFFLLVGVLFLQHDVQKTSNPHCSFLCNGFQFKVLKLIFVVDCQKHDSLWLSTGNYVKCFARSSHYREKEQLFQSANLIWYVNMLYEWCNVMQCNVMQWDISHMWKPKMWLNFALDNIFQLIIPKQNSLLFLKTILT